MLKLTIAVISFATTVCLVLGAPNPPIEIGEVVHGVVRDISGHLRSPDLPKVTTIYDAVDGKPCIRHNLMREPAPSGKSIPIVLNSFRL
jgi:hypothetical protein